MGCYPGPSRPSVWPEERLRFSERLGPGGPGWPQKSTLGGPRSQPWATRQAGEPSPRSPATWAGSGLPAWAPTATPVLLGGREEPAARPPGHSRGPGLQHGPGPAPRRSHCVTPGGVRRGISSRPSLQDFASTQTIPGTAGTRKGLLGICPRPFPWFLWEEIPRDRVAQWRAGVGGGPGPAPGARGAGRVPLRPRASVLSGPGDGWLALSLPAPRRAPALQADAGFRGSLRNPSPRGGRRPAGTTAVGLRSGTASVTTTCAAPAPARVRPACTPLLCEPVTGTWKPRGRPAHGQHGDTRGHGPDLAGLATVPGGHP
ncbi:hypothetical protein VULLAG_LOCUS23767 [Vulpes lagopus]